MKTLATYFFVIILLTSGCINEGIVNTNNLEDGSISFSLNKSNAPENVTKIIVYLTRKGFETKVITLSLTDSSSARISIKNLKIGSWHLLVQALDKNGNVLYSGETDVNVQTNVIVPVNLQLNSTTGGIDLIVTWGETGQNNLMAYYPFLGNANDLSNHRNNGTVYGAKLTEDRFGNRNSAYLFDGIDDYIKVPDNNSLTPSNNKITLAAWVKILGTNNKAILYKGSSYNNREYALGLSSKDMEAGFSIFDNGMWNEGQEYVASKILLNNDEWYFIVGVWDSKELKMYINGDLVNTKTVNVTIGNFDSDLFIGTYGGDIEKYAFKGIIDDIAIFNTALSSTEIKQIYDTTK